MFIKNILLIGSVTEILFIALCLMRVNGPHLLILAMIMGFVFGILTDQILVNIKK